MFFSISLWKISQFQKGALLDMGQMPNLVYE